MQMGQVKINHKALPLTTGHVGDSAHLFEHPIYAALSAVHLVSKVF